MKNKMQPKIAIYIRTATHDQNSETELIAQEATCRAFIDRKFPELAADKDAIVVYKDIGCSAFQMSRPGLTQLFEDLKNDHIKVIVAKDWERFYRRAIDATLIHKHLKDLGAVAHVATDIAVNSFTQPADKLEILWKS